MVRAAPSQGRDVSNRGIGRGRMFLGELILLTAVIAWFTGLWLSPSTPTTTAGLEGVRGTVVDLPSQQRYRHAGAVGAGGLAAVPEPAAAQAAPRLGNHRRSGDPRRSAACIS